MCRHCEPTFDGYVFWPSDRFTQAMAWAYSPSQRDSMILQNSIKGPLDLTIPYV